MNLKTTGKLFRNIVANSFTMVIMMGFQILSIPVFLMFWGAPLYGEWIVLNSLTAYFQMTDVGLNTATANSFTFHHVKGDEEKCRYLINNNFFFIMIAFAVIFIILISLISFNAFESLFQFKLIDHAVANLCLFYLFLQVLIGTLNNMLNTIYQGANEYARGIMIDNYIRISEYAALLSGVMMGLDLNIIVLMGVIVKIIGITAKFSDTQKFYKMKINFKYISMAELKAMFLPSLSFFSLPVANSFLFQGITLLINFFMGSVVVVVFNTSRTLINFIKSIIDVLHKSTWPELSLAFGKNDIPRMQILHRRTLILSLIATFASSVFIFFAGETIYNIWTNHEVTLNIGLFYFFILSLITNTIWSSSSVVLMATNNNKGFSLLYLIMALYVFVSSFFILKYTSRIEIIPLAIISADIILIIFVLKRALKLTEDSLENFNLREWKTLVKSYLMVNNKK
jgi:O-antigen/teichoic acid export membrane protein